MHTCYRPALLRSGSLRPFCCSASKSRKLKTTFRSPEVVNIPTEKHSYDTGTPFEDLQLQGLKVGRVRVRQHVNPFRRNLQTPSESLIWSDVYEDPKLPLWIDVGCGSGRFLLLLAKKHGCKFNYLGADIRDPLIKRANKWADYLTLAGSVHFIVSNMTISLESLLTGYPGVVNTIAVQFPDPHFKARHRKRHIVQESFVRACENVLQPGGTVYFQSDVLDCSVYMREMFHIHARNSFFPAHPSFREHEANDSDWSTVPWLLTNPMAVPTERELHASEKGFEVCRMVLRRK